MKNVLKWLVLCCMSYLLSGCGQSGKLYLPDPSSKSQPAKHQSS